MKKSADDSLGRRYLFKLGSNVASIPLFFLMEAVLPRALGPAAYGNYNFATTQFFQFTAFLDMGTSTCLNTSLAKRPREWTLLAFYSRIAMGVLVLCLLGGVLMHLPGAGDVLMPDVPLWMAVPAALWAYLTWAGRVARGLNDSLGLTVRGEPIRLGVNLVAAPVLLGLYFAGWLTLPVLFLQQYLCLGLMTLGFFLVMRGNWPGRLSLTIDRPQARAYVSEFREYSAPLFVTALFSAIAISVERWMLQYFDGSVEQGYFSISQRIGVACFVFVTAMIPLLTRELAVAHAKNDAREMARLLDRYAPMIYSVSAWMCCFVMVEAAAVLRLFGGEQFVGALLPVQIMALYSIHQGYGQLSGAVYYATGQTRLLRNLSLINQTVGLVMAWLFMAPGDLFGLGLGARGLAWKMLLAQFIAVNMFLYAATRHVPFHYGRNLLHQMICPLVCAGLALAARFTTEAIGLGDAASLPRFFISGMLYTAICIPASFLLPFAFGVRQGELITQGRRLLTWFSTR